MAQVKEHPAVSADRQHYFHPFTSVADQSTKGAHIMSRAEGIRVWDVDGREFIDSLGGLWCVNIGYGRKEMAEAVRKQTEELCYYHSFLNMGTEPTALLAERVANLAPGDLNHVFFCNSGSEANDTQVKIVWQYNNLRGKPQKKKIIARRRAYHGVTVAAASMTGLPPLHASFDLPLPGFLHVTPPHHYWEAKDGQSEREFSQMLADELRETIEREGPDTVGAFIAEPMMGAGGVVPPPEGYFELIQPLLKEYDILLIADEVISGFGRLGAWFGSQRLNIQPDLMSVAKGLTSGYVPMSACIVASHVFDVFKDASAQHGPFSHGYTYSGHPVAAAAGLCNLDIIERENLVENAGVVGEYFVEQAKQAFAEHPAVGEVRGLGLTVGVEIVKDKARKIPFEPKEKMGPKLMQCIFDHDLITRPIMNTIAMSPPLISTKEDCDEMIRRFDAGLQKFTREHMN